MKRSLALCAAAAMAAALLPSAVVGFQPAAAPFSRSSIKTKTTRMMAASPNNDDSVSRGGFLKSAALALGGGLLATTAATSIGNQAALAVPASEAPDLTPILLTYEGKPRRFGDILGKKYVGLEDLYERYKDQGFDIVGVGCNQFGGQEPEKMEKVRKDMKDRYGVQFTLYDKIEVNGGGRHPLYNALFQYEPELSGYPNRISWNFEKFLIDSTGKPVRRYRPGVEPEQIIPDLEKLLKTGTLPPAPRKKSLNDY